MKYIKQYALFIISVAATVLLLFINKPVGVKAVTTVSKSFKEMLLILPPVFILLGLLDVWVPRETMVRFMGEGSGIKGALLAFLLGSAAAGPLYVVFPIAAAFMRKDVKFSNILILIGAWSTTKIPMILFELSSLGLRFGLTRLALNIPIILIITLVMSKAFDKEEVDSLYERVNQLQ
ncbi:MAG: permease [Spirochaetales bacterium]|nr:permease [Spirochaetales bacterium]